MHSISEKPLVSFCFAKPLEILPRMTAARSVIYMCVCVCAYIYIPMSRVLRVTDKILLECFFIID